MIYLAHHGIKGQKWGVRRYHNYAKAYKETVDSIVLDSGDRLLKQIVERTIDEDVYK